MPEPAGILVDTSIWIKFFREIQALESVHLDELLQVRGVRTCAPVHAEVLSGAPSQRERSRLRDFFSAIPTLELPADLWEEVEEARFQLARRGRQTSLIDLMIACVAREHQTPLWSLDEDFSLIEPVVHFSRYLP